MELVEKAQDYLEMLYTTLNAIITPSTDRIQYLVRPSIPFMIPANSVCPCRIEKSGVSGM